MSPVMLKSRPTARQLVDRLASPVPAGIELYLDRQDLIGDDWLSVISERIQGLTLPPSFMWIVEAPIRTIGDQFFGVTDLDDDHRETIRRVLEVGASIGALAANIHLVAPTFNSVQLGPLARDAALSAARPLLRYYVSVCQDLGMIPQVENIPPIGRMREGAFVYSPIGARAADLVSLIAEFPSLRFTADLSHAALYLNWRAASPARVALRFRPIVDFYAEACPVPSLSGYLAELRNRITTIHVSNADGLFGEGLGYDDGPEDLDLALQPFVQTSCHLVTETLEPDPDQASGMRKAQSRLLELARAKPVRTT
ncbi:MAG TPA: hypothetical protein VKT80_17750 [Chloroflexota bacterium]|nr:hypothetical protein [Chloroflexota bacterium]